MKKNKSIIDVPEYISNPCTWGSYKRSQFTYEGGSTLFHFCASSCISNKRFESYIAVNVIFFANDETHAADVLERMLKFRIKCASKTKEEFGRPYDAQLILDHKSEWKFNIAPQNQFYTVGWASNDTIL